jgi:Crp-like helix-turn-helix domain
MRPRHRQVPNLTVILDMISQRELAAMAGVARENVSRVLSEWKRGKIISYSDHTLKIHNKPALQHGSNPEFPSSGRRCVLVGFTPASPLRPFNTAFQCDHRRIELPPHDETASSTTSQGRPCWLRLLPLMRGPRMAITGSCCLFAG